MTIRQPVVVISFLLAAFFSARELYAEMTVKLIQPAEGEVYQICSDIPLAAELEITDEELRDVRFMANGMLRGVARTAPYEDVWEGATSGNYLVYARARDRQNNSVYSDTVRIKVGDISNGDLIMNGGFDCGSLQPWSLQNYEGAVSRVEMFTDFYFDDSTYLYIDVENGSSEIWYIQLQHNFPIMADHSYEVTFLADADDTKDIEVGIQESHDPYTTYLWQTVTIDGLAEYGPFTYDSTVEDPTSIFKLNFGGNDIDAYVDNVRVIDRSMTSVKRSEMSFSNGSLRTYELFQCYPNPFNSSTRIAYRLSEAAAVDLSIYNIAGQLVRTLTTGRVAEGSHSLSWDGRDQGGIDVPSGVYLYRLTVRNGGRREILSRKMLLMK